MAGILKSTCCGSSDCPNDACSDCQCCWLQAPLLPYTLAEYGTPTTQSDWRVNMTATVQVSGTPTTIYARKVYSYEFTQYDYTEAGPAACRTNTMRRYSYRQSTFNIFTPTGPPTNVGPWVTPVSSGWSQVYVHGADTCGNPAKVYNMTNQNGGWDWAQSYPPYLNGGILVVFT